MLPSGTRATGLVSQCACVMLMIVHRYSSHKFGSIDKKHEEDESVGERRFDREYFEAGETVILMRVGLRRFSRYKIKKVMRK